MIINSDTRQAIDEALKAECMAQYGEEYIIFDVDAGGERYGDDWADAALEAVKSLVEAEHMGWGLAVLNGEALVFLQGVDSVAVSVTEADAVADTLQEGSRRLGCPADKIDAYIMGAAWLKGHRPCIEWDGGDAGATPDVPTWKDLNHSGRMAA